LVRRHFLTLCRKAHHRRLIASCDRGIVSTPSSVIGLVARRFSTGNIEDDVDADGAAPGAGRSTARLFVRYFGAMVLAVHLLTIGGLICFLVTQTHVCTRLPAAPPASPSQ